jgi:hypothetical protein
VFASYCWRNAAAGNWHACVASCFLVARPSSNLCRGITSCSSSCCLLHLAGTVAGGTAKKGCTGTALLCHSARERDGHCCWCSRTNCIQGLGTLPESGLLLLLCA